MVQLIFVNSCPPRVTGVVRRGELPRAAGGNGATEKAFVAQAQRQFTEERVWAKAFALNPCPFKARARVGRSLFGATLGFRYLGPKRNRRKLTKIDRKRMLWFPVLCKGCSGRLKSHSKSTTLSLKLLSGSSRETIDLLFASGATNQQLGGARFFCGLAFFSSCTCEPKLSTSLRQGCAFWAGDGGL